MTTPMPDDPRSREAGLQRSLTQRQLTMIGIGRAIGAPRDQAKS